MTYPCSVREARAAMDDGEFWEHVFHPGGRPDDEEILDELDDPEEPVIEGRVAEKG